MADIFLSYSREDIDVAHKLTLLLEKQGWSVYWDKTSILAGQNFVEVIENELQTCLCVLVLWSKNSSQSNWVRDEAEFGINRRILIPVLLDDTKLPIFLARFHAANLINWNGQQTDETQRLIKGVSWIIGYRETANIQNPDIALPKVEEKVKEKESSILESIQTGIQSISKFIGFEKTHEKQVETDFITDKYGASAQKTESINFTTPDRIPFHEAKLILVGFGGVGKTTLVNRLVHRLKFNKHEARTEGIAINEWPISLGNDRKVQLHVWDFGGQEIMHATHQFFLTTRSLYILVLNGRQGREDADAEYWLNLIKSFGSGSPVIIVLNKIKETPFDVNRKALNDKFRNIVNFISTDCEDDTGINNLHSIIKNEIASLPHLFDTYPTPWFFIKQKLTKKQDSFLSFDDYRRLCVEEGETDTNAQESLADLLHILGIALNYRDDPRLHDLHVLKPQWVTEGIYAILNAKKLAEENGELSLADLPSILNSKEYPADRQPFLIELMRKFELCFRFPDDDKHYLIPDLLDKQEPEITQSFKPEKGLAFEYHYESALLPEGLIPRFIVRTSALSANGARWRTGIILSFEGNRALVKGDPIDKIVHIIVDGSQNGQRRLLAVIRSHFEEIHRNYFFRPKEMVPVPGHLGLVVPYSKLVVLEQNNIQTLTEVFGEIVLKLNVVDLLNGVDLAGIRSKTYSQPERIKETLTAFISYSHIDEPLRAELQTHLMLFKRLGLLDIWTDRCITAGEEWKGQIDENIEQANLILLLISSDFINSDYCWDIELKRALERHKSKEAKVIPIIVRSCLWKKSIVGKLQVLPESGKPIREWGASPQDRDPAWTNVAEGIEKSINELISSKKAC